MRKQTPSQTVGPYFAYGLTSQQYHYPIGQIADGAMVTESRDGRVRVEGRIFDGKGDIIPDALVEFWQADPQGRYGSAEFTGFGRMGTGTDPSGRFIFDTVKPGASAGSAPFITITILMRGLLSHVYTRLYFPDEAAANAADPVLNSVPAERRSTLIAQKRETSQGIVYVFDVHMQGEKETVFFDL